MTSHTPTKAIDKPFSEVISSTNEVVIAQCYKEDTPTKLKQSIIQGSTVKIISSYDNSFSAFGLVTKVNNSSLDNIHKPSALGLSSKELELLQPQVYDLLRKELEIYLFAYLEKEGETINYPPSKPMAIHDFVYFTTNNEVIKITEDLSSIINLIKKNQLRVDILTNLIETAYKLRNNDYQYLVKAGKNLALAFSHEAESVIYVLQKLSKQCKNY